MWVDGQRHAPAALPPGKTRYPFVQEAGWAPGPVWTCAENLAPTGMGSQTVQPAASRYTDGAIPARHIHTVQHFMTNASTFISASVSASISVLLFLLLFNRSSSAGAGEGTEVATHVEACVI